MFLICLYTFVVYFSYQIWCRFLRAHWPWFDRLKRNPHKSFFNVILLSLFDVCLGYMPVVICITDYKRTDYFIISTLALIYGLNKVHQITGKDKT